ncbi:hypothetical protein [Haloarchaeobius salinus]|uniref:hypothetical protein n=1 Tax=Haloarchaeobius salinus TaxID=1198298 RepID=UPI00210B7CBF|nr:hypothetical protein [Haloarchaeobius salinus]
MLTGSSAVLVVNVLALVLFGPFLTLAHELGHAITGLLVTDRGWTAVVGDTAGYRLSVGSRLTVVFAPGAFRTPWFGFVRCDGDTALSRRATVAVNLAGPLVSAVAAVGLFAAASATDWWVGDAVFVPLVLWQAFTVAATLAPVRYPAGWGGYGGMESDGRRIVRAIRREPGD